MNCENAEIDFGESNTVVIRYGHSSTPLIAKSLGIVTTEDGSRVRVFLDRRVHKPGQTALGKWAVSGAITSILEGCASDVATIKQRMNGEQERT